VRRTSGGFTLLELLVVCAIVGVTLALVPVAFGTFGARSRLSSSANTILAQLTATREQATMDGFEARLEIGIYKDHESKRQFATRFWYSNLPAKGTNKLVEDSDRQRDRATSRAKDRQWMVSEWNPLPSGIEVSGISLEAGQWQKVGEGEQSFHVKYYADGTVERGFAVRLESTDLEVRPEFRTVTVVVNALTSEAFSYEGLKEMPRQKGSDEFR
jgi:prepilin-type N-terminal cleavage/methylation domain-containing protein